jgi:hypothetical protein
MVETKSNRTKKIIGILMISFFVASVTFTAVCAGKGGSHSGKSTNVSVVAAASSNVTGKTSSGITNNATSGDGPATANTSGSSTASTSITTGPVGATNYNSSKSNIY